MSKSAVKKFAFFTKNIDKLGDGSGIGEVATAFTGKKKFFAKSIVSFQKDCLVVVLGGGDGGYHAGRSAADYGNIE